MEFFDGFKPNSQEAQALSQEERERIIDLGAAAIIRMLYRDGFFHADLHAGNLMILPGKRVRVDLNRLGVWFADPADDDFCLGKNSPVTPFDGDDEAGVQAFNSRNAAPLP